jgi:hypothetical protein
MSRTSAYARLSRIVIFLLLTFSAAFGQVNGSALVSALTGKMVVPTVELGYTGSVANPLMVNGQPAAFPVKTLVYPDGHEWFRVESGILHADAAQYKTFNRGLEFRIGTVELKGDYLELKLPSVIEPKQSAVVKLMLGSGWQKTMTNEAVLKMADRFLSDPSQHSATVAAQPQPPAQSNGIDQRTGDAVAATSSSGTSAQSPEQLTPEANQAKSNVGSSGTDAGALEAGLAAEKRGDAQTTLAVPANIPPPVQGAPRPKPIPAVAPFAVIAQGAVQYHANSVGTTPPAGHLEAGQHLCVLGEAQSLGNGGVVVEHVRLEIPGVGEMDALYTSAAFLPDPSGDQACRTKWPQATDIGEATEFYGYLVQSWLVDGYGPRGENKKDDIEYLKILDGDAAAKNIMTKYVVSHFFMVIAQRSDQFEGYDIGAIFYGRDKFEDYGKSCHWSQMVLDQINNGSSEILPTWVKYGAEQNLHTCIIQTQKEKETKEKERPENERREKLLATLSQPYTRIPKKELVIAAIKLYMDEADDDLIRRESDLSNALANLPQCIETADTTCNGPEDYNGHVNGYQNSAHCDASERYACGARIDDMRKQLADFQLADFHYSSDQYVFSVVKTNPYEGNVISYVNLRVEGSDESKTDRIVLQFKNNKWVVVDVNAVDQ